MRGGNALPRKRLRSRCELPCGVELLVVTHKDSFYCTGQRTVLFVGDQ